MRNTIFLYLMFKKAIFVFKSLLSKHLSMCKRSQSYIIRKILFVVDFKEKDEKTTYFFTPFFAHLHVKLLFPRSLLFITCNKRGKDEWGSTLKKFMHCHKKILENNERTNVQHYIHHLEIVSKRKVWEDIR